jgi:DNA-binding PadR family transcriptional regulator
MQEVTRMTSNQVLMGPGTLYGTIKRMLKDGLIEESDIRPDPSLDDERRRYYRITHTGRNALNVEVHRMSRLLSAAQAKNISTPRVV